MRLHYRSRRQTQNKGFRVGGAMYYRLYLLSIDAFAEDAKLIQEALAELDAHRKAIVYRLSKEQDQLRAIAVGLLLRKAYCQGPWEEDGCTRLIWEESCPDGRCYRVSLKELVASVRQKENKPEPAYTKGAFGKPYWDRKEYFNLSHSGDYVTLVLSDREVGVDIQKARNNVRFDGGYQEFSRMEAFVKCTGRGFAQGLSGYRTQRGAEEGYFLRSFDFPENYALHLCVNAEDTTQKEQR